METDRFLPSGSISPALVRASARSQDLRTASGSFDGVEEQQYGCVKLAGVGPLAERRVQDAARGSGSQRSVEHTVGFVVALVSNAIAVSSSRQRVNVVAPLCGSPGHSGVRERVVRAWLRRGLSNPRMEPSRPASGCILSLRRAAHAPPLGRHDLD